MTKLIELGDLREDSEIMASIILERLERESLISPDNLYRGISTTPEKTKRILERGTDRTEESQRSSAQKLMRHHRISFEKALKLCDPRKVFASDELSEAVNYAYDELEMGKNPDAQGVIIVYGRKSLVSSSYQEYSLPDNPREALKALVTFRAI